MERSENEGLVLFRWSAYWVGAKEKGLCGRLPVASTVFQLAGVGALHCNLHCVTRVEHR